MKKILSSIVAGLFFVGSLAWAIGGGIEGTNLTLAQIGGLPLSGGTMTGPINLNSKAQILAGVSNGLIKLTNNAGTSGVILNVNNDGQLIVSSGLSAGAVLTVNGPIGANNGTGIVAGGDLNSGYYATTATAFGIFFGSGVPTISTSKGSLYLRSDGSTTNNRIYVNTDGGTTWTAITTAN